jgi:hypothetical protein
LPRFDNIFLCWYACYGSMSMYFLLMRFLIRWMTFKSVTSNFVDMFAFNHVTSSSIDAPIFKHATSCFVHAPTFKHLLSSTSSFKHWTSPFKEILMALRQAKKTRHRNSYTIIPLQTLKTLKLILSSYCETMHVWKKSMGRNLELHQNWCIFEFLMVPCVFHEHMVLTLAFLDSTNNFIHWPWH